MVPRPELEPDNSRINYRADVTDYCGRSHFFSQSELVERDSTKGSDKAGLLSERQHTTTPQFR
jgi:hypothetical protein